MDTPLRLLGQAGFLSHHRSARRRVSEDPNRKAVKNGIEIDEAEAIILGCTIKFGFYAELQKEFSIPIIDAVYKYAYYKETEHAALNKIQFRWKPCPLYSMAAPDPAGLGASGIFADDRPIGHQILVPRTCIRLVGPGDPGSKSFFS
ncbi:hypothetical protein MMC29_004688 [Sticta canariensis]|nr:hypothetical protein [Sticta canariensis]